MASLAQTIADTRVQAGRVMAWWLGGNGFVFKTPAGTQIYIDPYFSNCVAAIFGVERAFPPPITAEEARPDLVISTHWHEDHLDPEGLPIVAKHSQTQILGPAVVRLSLIRLAGSPRPRVQHHCWGDPAIQRCDNITAVAARHIAGVPGWESDDAVGVLLEFDGLRIYHSGDTEYDLRLRALAYDAANPIDVCMVVMNGVGGNMNAHEAALLAWQLGAKTIIPMHHLIWKDFSGGVQATVDPQLMAETYRRLGGTGKVKLLNVGEGVELQVGGDSS